MAHRIREEMDIEPEGPLGGPDAVVEADEAYVGGKQKNRATGRVEPKKPVMVLVEREGHARSFHVANVNAKEWRGLIAVNGDRPAHLMTEEAPVYIKVGREYYGHGVVNHSKKEYVTYGGFKHSNTAENFFSIFKRGVIGTYYHMIEAHLGSYSKEFDFHYNTRNLSDTERAAEALKGARGKRLTYKQLRSVAA